LTNWTSDDDDDDDDEEEEEEEEKNTSDQLNSRRGCLCLLGLLLYLITAAAGYVGLAPLTLCSAML